MYINQSTGLEFEDEMIILISDYAKKFYGEDAVQFAKTKEERIKADREQGTDFLLYGIPVDTTLNFHGKDNMDDIGEMPLNGFNVNFGFRKGNKRKEFNTPVLVIGASSPVEITKNNMWYYIQEIKTNIQNILDKAFDLYYDAIDSQEALA